MTAVPDPVADRAPQPPAVLRVVSGDATAEEVVALVTALAAAAGRRGGGPLLRDPSRWADRTALLHAPPRPGPGAWRAAAWRR